MNQTFYNASDSEIMSYNVPDIELNFLKKKSDFEEKIFFKNMNLSGKILKQTRIWTKKSIWKINFYSFYSVKMTSFPFFVRF